MTDLRTIQRIETFCVKNGNIEVRDANKYGTYTLVVPVFNGADGEDQIVTLEMEFSFDGYDFALYKFPYRLLTAEDYIDICEYLMGELDLSYLDE